MKRYLISSPLGYCQERHDTAMLLQMDLTDKSPMDAAGSVVAQSPMDRAVSFDSPVASGGSEYCGERELLTSLVRMGTEICII